MILSNAKQMLTQAQDQQEAAAPSHRAIDFREGDNVLLSTRHLPLTYGNAGDGSKLQHRFAGPFKVLWIQGNTAKLDLSRDLSIEDIHNVGYLKRYYPSRQENPPPPLLWRTGEGAVHEVDRIVEHKWVETNRRNIKYRVRWVGFGEADDEWLLGGQLKDYKEKVNEYHARMGLEPVLWGLTQKERRVAARERRDKVARVKRIILQT